MKRKLTRRQLLRGTAALAASVNILSCKTASYAAARKLNIACVGIGGKGRSDVMSVSSENIVAVCDVDLERGQGIFKEFPDAARYQDYRKMLRELGDKIDAVTVSTPDHMHYPVARTAIEMGKHVYVQKPLTHHVYEARHLAQLAREHNVATQMGNQGQAEEGVRVLCEYLWDGAIGPVREVHVWTNRPIWPQAIERPAETPPVPETLDWDVFLGVAPERPYNPAYHPFKWRGWKDFGTGALGDIACHSLSPVFRALKLGPPTSVEAVSSPLFDETYPAASIVRYQFPARENMPAVKLSWYDGGLKPPRPDELEPGRELGEGDTLYIGDKGKILGNRLIPEARMREYPQPDKTLPRSIGHYEEWLAACKGGAPGGSDFSFAGPLTEAVLLGNVALLTQKRLEWDGDKMEITNVPEANVLLRREYRDGWI
jgi:predicted dehydrogenase